MSGLSSSRRRLAWGLAVVATLTLGLGALATSSALRAPTTAAVEGHAGHGFPGPGGPGADGAVPDAAGSGSPVAPPESSEGKSGPGTEPGSAATMGSAAPPAGSEGAAADDRGASGAADHGGEHAASSGSSPARTGSTGAQSLRQGATPLPAAPRQPASDTTQRPGLSLDAAAAQARPNTNNQKGPRARDLSPAPKVSPNDVLAAAKRGGAGGCLPGYGRTGQCLPTIPPSQAQHAQQMREAGQDPSSMAHPWSCSELRQYFKDGIEVRVAGNAAQKSDPQKLDTNKDGVACGAGDNSVGG